MIHLLTFISHRIFSAWQFTHAVGLPIATDTVSKDGPNSDLLPLRCWDQGERERERERENLSSSVSERRERRDDQMYECTVCIRAFVYRTGCRNSDEVYELIPL